jgi:uncharacterized membrane protein
MTPDVLSHQLREGSGKFLARRRGVVGLSLVSIGAMGVITLYQMGIIKHLPEPPLPYLDADKVDASSEAYAMLSVPDATLGLLSYAATIVLAAMGDTDRARTQPYLPLALLAKTLGDAAQAGKLTVDQWTKHRAFCSWCLLAAGATFATVPLAVAEARAAYRQYAR